MGMRTKREIEAKFEEFKIEYKKMSDNIDEHTVIEAGRYVALAAIVRILSWVLGIQNNASVDPEE